MLFRSGIPDYAARYGASLERMASDTLMDDPFGPRTVDTIMGQWPGAQEKERIATLSRWRDRRLTALKAHKRTAVRKPSL